jgi:flagellar basal-body rod protein FlgG
MAQSDKLDTIANNLANVDTPAFKRDEQVFREYLSAYEKQPDVIEAPKVPASVESFYPINGADKSYVDSAGTSTSFSQGSLQITNNPLDMAIEGDGFFEVMTTNGPRLTRNGSFTLNAQGELVTKQGFPVMLEEQPGQPVQNRFIRLGNSDSWSVSPYGDLMVNNEAIGKLSLLTAENKDVFQKEGSSLYKLRETIASPLMPAKNMKLHQGAIEKSNVNIVIEMTDMIKTTRVVETKQKAIQAYDAMNGKMVNEVSKLR